MFALIATLALGAEPLPTLPAWNSDFVHAAKHAAGAPKDLAPHLRYVTDYASEGMKPEDLAKRQRAQWFAVNLTSRKAVIAKLIHVKDTCYAVDLRHFGWTPEVWEKFVQADPYFHRFVKGGGEATYKEVKKRVPVEKRYRDRFGRIYTETVYEEQTVKEKVPATATHAKAVHGRGIDPIAIKTLCEVTGSQAPVVRLDWLIWMQSGTDRRAGAGYYDFLGVERSLAKFEDLVGLDRKKAADFRAEYAVLIQKSGVLADGRERAVLRIGKIDSDWWESQDTFRRGTTIEERQKLALTDLDKRYKPDAFEIFAKLRNGLYATAAADANGVLQDFVPNSIAGDHFGKANDYVIESGMKCLRCHDEGLKPLDDYARKYFRADKWKKHDAKKQERFQALYIRPFQAKLKSDVADYLSTVVQFGYTKISECHAEYAKLVDDYWQASVDATQMARELGVPKDVLIEYIKRTDGLWGKLPAPPLSRRGFEVRFDLYLEALGYE